ncbi:MAG: aldo/keto reductase [Steroidobacteraceae bacterium]
MDARSRSTISRREVLCAGLLASLGTGALASRAAGAASAGDTASAGDAPGSGGASGEPLLLKPIPSTGERIPVIGLGTDAFRESEQDAIRQEIAKMHQLGGRVIDTAASYGDSEALIGEALADSGLGGKMFIATKLTNGEGFFGGGIGGKASFDRSLQRLKSDKVDLLQVHNLSGVDELMPLLRDWKRAGKIRYYGVTTSRVGQHDDMVAFMRKYPLDFIQVDYSIANRDAEKQIFPLAIERRIAVLANLPLIHGQLMEQASEHKLPDFARAIGVSGWSQFLLKYVASHPAVTCAIPGSTKVAHLIDNQRAGRGTLPDAAMRRRMEQYWDRVTA